MKQIKNLITILIPGLFALLMSGNAAACSPPDPACPTGETWNFSGDYWLHSELSFVGSEGHAVTATGWSNSNDASNWWYSSYGTGNLVRRDIAGYGSSGLGVASPDDYNSWSGDLMYPDHATDNSHRVDSILLDFHGVAVTLSQIKFGYVSGDSDFSIAAYTGSAPLDLASIGYDQMTAANGWKAIESYDGPGTSAKVVNDDLVSSSYWLISALNPKLGGSMDYSYDYFKLSSIDICDVPPPSTVPEPSTLLLLGCVALISLLRSRLQKGGQCSIAA